METGPSNRSRRPMSPIVQAALDKLHKKHPEALRFREEREESASGPRPRVLRAPHVPVRPPVTPPTEVEQLELIQDENGHWIKK